MGRLVNLFNASALRSFINRSAKTDFFYNHEQGWLCNGYAMVRVDYNARHILKERLLKLTGDILIRGGELRDQAAPDLEKLLPKNTVPAEMTPFLHQQHDNLLKRVFVDASGKKTAVNEVYAKIAGSYVEWHMSTDQPDQNPPTIVGKYKDRVVILILPIRTGWDKATSDIEPHMFVIEDYLKKEKDPA